MERDFLGLALGSNSIHASTAVNEDSALGRGSVMQWSLSNKVSAVPQLLSFKSAQQEMPRNTNHDLHAPTGFMARSNADVNLKHYSAINYQRKLMSDKQGGNQHYATTPHGMQYFDAQEFKIFPASNQQNQSMSVSTNYLVQPHRSAGGQNMVGSAMRSQPLGGIQHIAPISVIPATSSAISPTDLRSSAAPAQLTIFYAGSVNVYDDVSPEKAQAIMLLAGNGSSTSARVRTPNHRFPTGDNYIGTTSHITSSCSGLPSPIYVASVAGSQTRGGSCSTTELATVRPFRALASASKQTEPAKVPGSVGSPAGATLASTGGLPLARKASLARFMEKRKERMMNTSPYGINQKSANSSSGKSEFLSFSVSSAASSLPTLN